MTRKDNDKDSERPHYYSQFWLDVAAGRRIIGGPKPSEEDEPVETEASEPRKAARSSEPLSSADANGYAAPADQSGYAATETEDEELHEAAYATDYQQDFADADADADAPDVYLGGDEAEGDEAEGDEAYEDEEEEEEDWTTRGRKKKAARAAKPASKKAGKRDSRRTY